MKVLSRSAGGGLIRSRGVQRDHRGLDSSCGGCDNDTTSSTNLAAAKASFVSFFNAVGGITNYYGFLPFFSPGAARVWPSGKPRVSRGRAGYSDERDIFTTDSQRAD